MAAGGRKRKRKTAKKRKTKGHIPLELLVKRYHKLGNIIQKRGVSQAKLTRRKR